MAMNFTATPFRDIISRIGDPNNPANLMASDAIQDFRRRTAFTDMNPLRRAKELSNGFANQTYINNLLSNKQTVNHNTYVDLWNIPSLTTSSSLTFAGFNAGSTQRKQIPTGNFTLHAFKFDIDVANAQTWDALYSPIGNATGMTLQRKLEMILEYYLVFGDAAIKEAINTALVAFIDANKYAGGGLGTRYTAVGNTKIIPAIEPYADAFPGIISEMISNRFSQAPYGVDPATWKTECSLLGDPNLVFATNQARIRGTDNQTNHNMLLQNYATIVPTNSIAVANAVTDDFRAYLLDKGALQVNTWVPDMNAGEFANPADYFESRFDIPTTFPEYDMGNLMNYNLVVRKAPFTDDNATYGTEESRQNTHYQGILYTWSCFTLPDGATPAAKPIVEYVKLK